MRDTGFWGEEPFAELGRKDGTILTGLFACSYSISPRSLLRWISKGLGERGGKYDFIQALAAAVRLKRLLESSVVLFQEGCSTEARGQFERLISSCLIGVPARPIPKGKGLMRQVFHPKVAVFTFADGSFRIYFGSQNLQESPCLEAGLILEGAPGKKLVREESFFGDLNNMVRDFIGLLPPGHQKRAYGVWKKLGNDLRKGRLTSSLCPRLLWQIPGERRSLWQETQIECFPPDLVVSPWADPGVLSSLLKGGQPLKLWTLKPTLEKLALSANKFEGLLGYTPSSPPRSGQNIDEKEEISEEDPDLPNATFEPLHPHAKIYVTRKDRSVMLGSANLTGPGLGRSGRRNAECLVRLRLNEHDFDSVWDMFPDLFHKLVQPRITLSVEGDQSFLSNEELLALLDVRWVSYPRSVRLKCPPAFRPYFKGFLVSASRSRSKPSFTHLQSHDLWPHMSTIQLEQASDDRDTTEGHGASLLQDGCQIWLHAMRRSIVTSVCRVVPLDSLQWVRAFKSIEAVLLRKSPASLLAAHLGLLEAPIGGGGGDGDPGDPAGSRPGAGSTRAWRVERVIAGLVQGAELSSKLKRELLRIAERLPGKNERASLPTLLAELTRLNAI